jgi:hypothetical protein
MRAFAILLFGSLSAAPAAAQGAADEALSVVRRMFDSMRAQDTAAMRAMLHSSVRLIATTTNPQGQPAYRSVPIDAWLGSIARAPGKLDERIYDPEVRVDDNLATVWTRYDFFVGDNFSHCGYDSFQLARLGGAWKIIQVADTQRRGDALCGRGNAAAGQSATPPADTAVVVGAVQRLFDAMAARDTTALRALFVPTGQLLALRAENSMPRSTELADFITSIGSAPSTLRERMVDPEVRISDNLATVWTWYDFHRGDQFSHCGVDAAQLVRTIEGWKIAQVSYTVRGAPCDRRKGDGSPSPSP